MNRKRNTLFEEKHNEIEKRKMSLIQMVHKRAAKMQITWAWYKLIHCAEFVESYNKQAQTTPILLRGIYNEKPNTFHAETQLNQSKNFSFFPCSFGSRTRSKFIYFLEIEDDNGKLLDLNMSCYGSVVSSCNGLILITSMNEELRRYRHYSMGEFMVDSRTIPGKLIVMNPMTRKLIGFPVGTLPGKLYDESYGLMFSHSKGVYKVVHLFKDESGFIGCEILSLKTRSWKAVDGPVGATFHSFGHTPIPTKGGLHWVLGSVGYDYILSMGVDDEKFFVTDLPQTMGKYDRLVEMGGFLSFVTGLYKNHIEVWILKEFKGTTKWVKHHTIRINASPDYVDFVENDNVDNEEHGNVNNEDNAEHGNVNNEDNAEHGNVDGNVDDEEISLSCFALNGKEMVFRRREKMYVYDFEVEEIREIKMDSGKIMGHENIMPHSNNLATWEHLEPMS
ncbi:uncharacterized protein [Spinacia oleracea]|uniref:Uncharacterized protein isoform X2 n=1 Tax=Spinacia oleracea TaxID=3562 RepID=A0A9R0JT60_SPIOL|nr:uncharacterized protein LOC110785965 isoform X2 [Spinacia oleracea]XP_056693670.1 uncharacterized protein LOC110785965 isoform X2 [Spinacia oleracea]